MRVESIRAIALYCADDSLEHNLFARLTMYALGEPADRCPLCGAMLSDRLLQLAVRNMLYGVNMDRIPIHLTMRMCRLLWWQSDQGGGVQKYICRAGEIRTAVLSPGNLSGSNLPTAYL